MARPIKVGLDYFPMDCDMDQDVAVQYLEAQFGLTGFAVLVKLLMRIYRDKGYYIEWNAREQFVFARAIGCEPRTVDQIIEAAIGEGLFDRQRYEQYGILTSRGIQSRYLEAASRRLRVIMYTEYLVGRGLRSQYPNINAVSVNDNSIPADMMCTESTQSKGKESKGEESITRTRAGSARCPRFLTNDCPGGDGEPAPSCTQEVERCVAGWRE